MPAPLQTIDENILFFIQAHMKSPVLDPVMVFFTKLGNAGLIWVAAAILLLSLKQYRKCGIYLAISLYLATLLGDEILKPVFGRIRPCNEFPQIALLIGRPHSYSFPSGHTMVGFAAATVLLYFNRKFGAAGFLLASLIAFSRLYLFVHYPTDVLGGIIFGVLSSILSIFALNAISDILKSKDDKS